MMRRNPSPAKTKALPSSKAKFSRPLPLGEAYVEPLQQDHEQALTKHVYTIDPSQPFLQTLADELWHRAEQDVFKLSQNLILLPTRRACRMMQKVFLARTGQQAMLLPRLQPLGDIDEDELYFASDIGIDTAIPPAISPLRRQLLLTQLVSKKDPTLPIEQAAHLAEALGEFLNDVQIEGAALDKLSALVADRELALHWQETVAFLDILTREWPNLLAAEGCIDPADRRNRVLRAQAAAWRARSPDYPIIAAGSTGSIPAAAELLDAIAGLPWGTVVLPGLDQELDEAAWQEIDAAHPQWGIKRLLEKMDVARTNVKVWGDPSMRGTRLPLLAQAMRPAAAADDWQNLRQAKLGQADFTGLSRLTLDHAQDEAQAIALMMRQALEVPHRTATLVTPDRGLAEQVCAALRRWNIVINDSAGASLSNQPVGAFLRDLLAAAQPDAGAVALLSLLKHPFAACGLSPVECRNRARELELTVWRTETPATSEWLAQIRQMLQPLTAAWPQARPLTDWIAEHVRIAEIFAATDEQAGAERLWHAQAGETAAAWLEEWRRAAVGFPAVSGDDYAALFGRLIRAVTVRPDHGQHPRLNIFGLLEARLMPADVMILGGLNEGNWPPEPPVDPWMSRPMRQDFGLSSSERRIGLAAHDFVQLVCGSAEVVLTRARRVGNALAVPSRFLLQLETVLRGLGWSDDVTDALAPALPWQDWARQLDAADMAEPMPPPRPCPPVAARPCALSVTEIGLWRRNPYAIYARHILNLRKLDELDAVLDASDRGILIHAALDQFARTYPNAMPTQALECLLKIGRKIFAPYREQPEVAAFWWPRFEKIAAWFIAQEIARRSLGITLAQAEASGKITVGDFTLKGRADRIDRLADGKLSIIDYKTGATPTLENVKTGHEPQLPLLALIAARGGFKDLAAASVAEVAYWKLSGARSIAGAQKIDGGIDEIIAVALADLERLIAAFADPDMPYLAVPIPALAPRYDDYAQLARLQEWGRTEVDL